MADIHDPKRWKRVQKAIFISGSNSINELNDLLEDNYIVLSTTAQHIGGDTGCSGNILVILEKYTLLEVVTF